MIKRDLATMRTQLDKFIASGAIAEITNTLAQLAGEFQDAVAIGHAAAALELEA